MSDAKLPDLDSIERDAKKAETLDPNSNPAVTKALELWRKSLVSFDGNNRQLFYKTLKVGEVNLQDKHVSQEALSKLLSGKPIRVSHLYPSLINALNKNETPEQDDTEIDEVQAEDSESEEVPESKLWPTYLKRFENIYRKTRQNSEERNIDTCFIAQGFATWSNRQPIGPTGNAPFILYPVSIKSQSRGHSDFDLELIGEPMINEALCLYLESEYGVPKEIFEITSEEISNSSERISTMISEIAKLVHGFSVLPNSIMSNFAFLYYPMVVDLQRISDKGTTNTVLRALAGVESGITQLEKSGSEDSERELSRLDPYKEHLVFPADSSQHVAISAVMGGKTIVIQGPPGTGKSQTISNVIAECAANGKSVLFVAEKRAAIDAVSERLAERGLSDIILDLHGEPDKKLIAKQLLSVQEIPTSNRRATYIELQKLLQNKETLQSRWEWLNENTGITIGREPMTIHDLICEVGLRSINLSRDDIKGINLIKLSSISWQDHNAILEKIRTLVITDYFQQVQGDGPCLDLLNNVSSLEDVEQIIEALDVLNSFLDSNTFEQIVDAFRSLSNSEIASVQELYKINASAQAVFGLFQIWKIEHTEEILNALPIFQSLKAYRTDRNLGFLAAFAARKNEISAVNSYLMTSEGSFQRSVKMEDVTHFIRTLTHWNELGKDVKTLIKHKSLLTRASEIFGQVYKSAQIFIDYGSNLDPDDIDVNELRKLSAELNAQRNFIRSMPQVNLARHFIADFDLLDLADELGQSLGAEKDFSSAWDFAWFVSHLQKSLAQGFKPEFGSAYLNESLVQFRKRDQSQLLQNPERILFAMKQKLGDTNSKEFRFLKNAAGLKSRHKTLRELFSEAPNEILKLKPCFAMSPLAVSRLLPCTEELFDVVIFDEASQVRPEHAITSIYRGKQLVIAGDQHQLPPTDGMTSSASSPTDGGGVQLQTDNMESILDVGVVVFPSYNVKPLAIHYRSSDEKLISWSNFNIYRPARAELFTFPSVENDKSTALRHTFIPDVRTQSMDVPNPSEIKVVQDLVLRHINESPHLSLGVIAFGSRHANRLQDSFNVLEKENNAFYKWKMTMEDGREKFFVKNIERVQGDERDAIIISPGYAPNLDGILPMQFGWLNREGGERRINVAASRAKEYMHLVTSVRSSDFDLTRTSSRSIALFKSFIEFMENDGRLAEVENGFGRPETPFEEQILEALQVKGLLVDCQVGASKYKLDFAIRHPETNQYILAIEADGAAYHSSAYARERDWLRQQVLERKGWNFARIWSTDWWENPDREIDKVLETYKSVLNRVNAEIEINSRKATEMESSSPVTSSVLETSVVPEMTQLTVDVIEKEQTELAVPASTPIDSFSFDRVFKPATHIVHQPVPSQFPWLDSYQQWQPKEGIAPIHISRESITITDELLDICNLEGPILGTYLFREHYKATGGSSLSPANEKSYARWANLLVAEGKLIKQDLLQRHNDESVEYLTSDQVKGLPRTPGPRSLYEIPPSEIAGSFERYLTTLAKNETNEAICRAVLNGLGFTSLTIKAKDYLEAILINVFALNGVPEILSSTRHVNPG